MTLIARVLGVVGKDLQISGHKNFEGNRWRDAILYYLFGIWSDNPEVMYRPKISFGDITLRLDKVSGEYYAYGQEEQPEAAPCTGGYSEDEILVVTSGKQEEVEVALIRFVKNNRIKQLYVYLPACRNGYLVLWKGSRRGEYGYAGMGLPYSWGTQGPVWTREEYDKL